MDDDERLRVLFERYAARVYAYASRHVDAASAQDVVSEVYLTAWRRRDALPGNALPWLLVVARNTIMNLRRANARAHNLLVELEALEHTLAGARPADDDTDDREAALAALRRLTERQREAVLLVAWDGLSIPDAAQVAGCSRGTFEVRLHRARVRLRAAWGEAPPEREPGRAATNPERTSP